MEKNEMMDRPIVDKKVVNYLRKEQRQFTGIVATLEQYANERKIPIIPHETALFLDFLLGQLKPKYILEIGAAIGFSGILMAQHLQEDGHLTTIDRFDVMITRAKENIQKAGLSDKMTLLEGDAKDILPSLTQQYDVIFMDSAKSKYIEFLPYCMNVLRKGGVLLVDDIFQGGTVLDEIETIPRRSRTIHRKLKRFLSVINTHPQLKTTILPLGDGVAIVEKLSDEAFVLPDEEQA